MKDGKAKVVCHTFDKNNYSNLRYIVIKKKMKKQIEVLRIEYLNQEKDNFLSMTIDYL